MVGSALNLDLVGDPNKRPWPAWHGGAVEIVISSLLEVSVDIIINGNKVGVVTKGAVNRRRIHVSWIFEKSWTGWPICWLFVL